ncbi:cation diffusion facilitator family transporter [Cohnella rhizosphaerae]|uniref:Cation diffusion facilitator family transporter n=1 Tax=Cohnella rhizosphaerae TaxID=1457232 RepID=A0A9X4QWK9_9BACL|nr:cation diffusion facilitator family transporter [Cohnella rhizosphaerae]MDG0813673.1 cation diffusion facilitator family transporter [Cohnella rhizosphaerae]
MTQKRTGKTLHGIKVSLLGLLVLSVFKGLAGWFTGSKALMADACHSAADFAAAVNSYLRHRRAISPRGAAERQREAVAAVVFAALLLLAGLEMAISSLRAIAWGEDRAPGWGAVIVIAAGMIAREALILYRRSYEHRMGLRPEASRTDRSDVFASLTALVGTAGAMTGQLLDLPVLYVLDPAAGLVIGVFVLRMGYRQAASAIGAVERRPMDEVDAQTLLEVVQRVDGVVAVDELRAKEHGHYVIIDVLIRVNPRISVLDGHDVAQRVRRQLTKRFLHVSDASVRVEPYDPGYPYKSNHQEEEMPTLIQ